MADYCSIWLPYWPPEVEEKDEIVIPEHVIYQDKRTRGGRYACKYLLKFLHYPVGDAKWVDSQYLSDILIPFSCMRRLYSRILSPNSLTVEYNYISQRRDWKILCFSWINYLSCLLPICVHEFTLAWLIISTTPTFSLPYAHAYL